MSDFAILRYQRVAELGCLACRQLGLYSPCDVHHMNADGKAGQARRGDFHSVGLCPWHHRGVPVVGLTQRQSREQFGPSLALDSRAFRAMFGDDDHLLAMQERMLERIGRQVVGKSL